MATRQLASMTSPYSAWRRSTTTDSTSRATARPWGGGRVVPGKYHSVNPIALMRYPDVYADNERQIVKCRADFRDFYLVDVGAFGVGTIVQTYSGDRHAKGEEKGFFKFGGSTVIFVAKAGVVRFDDDIMRNSSDGLETRVLYCEKIASPAPCSLLQESSG